MNSPQIPWNPVHPAMIPLTQKHIEIGLRHIATLREKLTQPIKRKRTPNVGITNKYRPASFKTKNDKGEVVTVSSSQIIEQIACQRQEPLVNADIAELVWLDNQKLGLYHYA